MFLSLFVKSSHFQCLVLCPLCYASYSVGPIQSNYRTLPTEAGWDIPRVTLKNKGITDFDNLRYNIH